MLDLYASSDHYAAHLWPIWMRLRNLGLAERAYSARAGAWWREYPLPRPGPHRGVQPVIVASYVDYQRTHPAPVIYVEHGAGQTYDGDPVSAGCSSYSGGVGLDRVMLFITPSEQAAQRWRERYPSTPAVAVGCPALDRWHAKLAASRSVLGEGGRDQRSIALTFHWDCPLVAESLSAWRHYDRTLPRLVEWARARDVELLGHGHPRIWRRLEPRWQALGVEPVRRFDDVLVRAGLLIADNTSAMFEFASLDRPVLVLNAPWYRRDVEHGGRFWSWADVGVQCDEPAELLDRLQLAMADPVEVRANRERIVSDVYAHRDGHASERAVDAIVEVLNAPVHRKRSIQAGRGF